MLKPFLLVLAAAALAGCTPTSGPLAAEAYTVRLVNEGAVPLYDVRVMTGPEESTVTRASLAPGGQTAFVPVRAVHENPVVRVIANGREVSLLPIEGFDGFNAVREPGMYVIRLRYVLPDGLSMQVTKVP